MWLLHPDFKEFVKDAWKCNGGFNVMNNFRACAYTLKYLVKNWNKTTFGNLKVRKGNV